MAKLRVLFVGGTGVISSACSRVAVEHGIDLFVLNRGRSTDRPLPAGVTTLQADAREPRSVRQEIKDLDFDAVAIAAADPDWGAGLLGDKAHSMIFDNAKVRGLVPGWRAVIPFEQGAREIADWYRADPARQVTDARLDAVMNKLAAAWSQR